MMSISNDKIEVQNVKPVSFELHESLHNLDGVKCGMHIALPQGKIVCLR